MRKLMTLGLVFISMSVVVYAIVQSDRLNKICNHCLVPCPDNYKICKAIVYDYNGEVKKRNAGKPCIFNLWNMSHIVFFAALAYFFYKYRVLIFIVGVAWECMEYTIGHNNNLDILWNLIGIAIGSLVHNL